MPTENRPAISETIGDAPLEPTALAIRHTREVLRRLFGYDGTRVKELVETGVVEERLRRCFNEFPPTIK